MKCRKAKKQLVLFVGDDLPERKKTALLSHMEQCPECVSELEKFKRSREYVKTIAQNDLPGTLPSDFSANINRLIIENEEHNRLIQSKSKFHFRLKPAMVLGIFALGILLITGTILKILSPGKISPDQLFKEIQLISYKGNPELEWDPEHIIFKAFEGPFRLDIWESPGQAGVYAVMHKADPENRPNTFIIDYCGHGRNLSLYTGYPWIQQRKKRLVARTGSLDNVYIAVFLMPGSSKQERRRIEKALIKAFDPYFN